MFKALTGGTYLFIVSGTAARTDATISFFVNSIVEDIFEMASGEVELIEHIESVIVRYQ